jgi:hypothetical protein
VAVQIRIDQAAKAAGVAGQAREDLSTGSPVTATALGGPYSAYLWTLAWKPVDVVAGTRSSAALSAASAASTLITPIDKPGTYRLSLAVDSGSGLGALEDDNAAITFYAGPTLSSDPGAFPRRQPAIGETIEHNVPDAIDPTGNVDGWGRERTKWDYIGQRVFSGVGSVISVPLFTGIASTSFDGSTPIRIADRMLDRSKLQLVTPANAVKLIVEIEATSGCVANIDLIDVDGVATGGGGPGSTVSGAIANTAITNPTQFICDVSAALKGAAPGRFRLRLWSSVAGKFVTCSYAFFELS